MPATTFPNPIELELPAAEAEVIRRVAATSPAALVLGGSGDEASWSGGPLLALGPRVQADSRALPAVLEPLLAARRATGGTADTGVAALVAYDALDGDPRRAGASDGTPAWLLFAVDRSLRLLPGGRGRLSVRGPETERGDPVDPRRLADALAEPVGEPVRRHRQAKIAGAVRTSLPREAYLDRVAAVKRHITAGDIYQANLCQRFEARFRGDPAETYLALTARDAPPHAAFVRAGEAQLVSLSPETFLRMRRPGHVETLPIKGTRPRGSTPDDDRHQAEQLQASEKDRAELLMIVDLERNDLSRVCMPGSVRVSELAGLRSFATVHHLVAQVHGRLKPGVGPAALLAATFPGGSITGAPKLRAMEILRALEPVPRGWFTGCLFWFGDDGSMDSSILIRTLVFHRGRVLLGAGGGIVADSEAEAEWCESNHKARALARSLGFEPEHAL